MCAKHEPERWSTGRNAFFVPRDGLMGEGLQNVQYEGVWKGGIGLDGNPAFKHLSSMHVMAMCAWGTRTSMST
jgi:hypothetical protein